MPRIVNLSYSYVKTYNEPVQWLSRIAFFTVILESLAAHAEVHAIYHINHQSEMTHNNVHYHFQRLSFWAKWLPWRFHSFVKQLRPDAIIVHGFIFPWQVWWLRAQLDAEVDILLVHHAEKPYRSLRKWMQRKAFKGVDAFLFPSYDVAQPWLEEGLVDRSRIFEVFGSASIFQPVDRASARAATGIAGERNFLWVGRLDDNKDPVCAINGFASIAGKFPDSRLYLIYQADELLEQCRQRALELGVIDNVIFVGAVNHSAMGDWYNSVNYIISCSHYEGSGIAVSEAMSCGCFPILTDIPSFRMLTNNGELGLHYPPGDSARLGQHLMTLLRTSPKTREQVIDYYKNNFSADVQAMRIMNIVSSQG